MAEIHRNILDNWKASDWEVHSDAKGVTKFTLYDDKGNTIVTDTLLNLSDKGHDKGNSEKDYSTDTY